MIDVFRGFVPISVELSGIRGFISEELGGRFADPPRFNERKQLFQRISAADVMRVQIERDGGLPTIPTDSPINDISERFEKAAR